ncbi:MAG: DNA primase [Acholeplasmataceae bacterium]|nr:DNA primase [Acholeplasmataceae bacterium]
MIDNKILDEINDKVDIVSLVSEYVELHKVGKNYSGLCPFHNDTHPSFSVSPEKNIAKCMSCGEGGRPINFYRKIKNISFDQAASELAERIGLTIETTKKATDPNEKLYQLMEEVARFYQFNLKNSTAGHQALTYLMGRGMTDQLIDHFQLGYAPSYGDTLYTLLRDKGHDTSDMIALGVVKQNDKGDYYDMFSERVIFPITDPKGHVVGFSGRTLSKTDQIKYVNSPETSIFKKGRLLYHFFEALPDIRRERQIILFEGFFDVIAAYGAGIKNGVATMGTALTGQHISLIRGATKSLIISFDGDNAGLKAADGVIEPLIKGGLKTEVMVIPDQMDPDEFIRAYGPEAYDRLFSEHVTDPYAFRYNYYRRGLDLQNANDLKAFKDRVLNMLRNADVTIAEMFRKKLAKDLEIDESRIMIPSKTPPKRPDPVALEKPAMPDRYEKAERYLLFAMLTSRETSLYVQEQLKTTDFVNHVTALLRLRIETYYADHETLDVYAFVDTLPENERTFLTEVLFKDPFWVKPVVYDQDEIDTYIGLVRDVKKKRRLNDIQNIIKETVDQPVDHALIEERDRLRKELKTRTSAKH